MEEDFKVVTPMRPLREVLAEFEAMIDVDENGNDVCEKCNNTGTELLRDEQGRVVGGKPCRH